MSCFSGVIKNGQIALVCYVTKAQPTGDETPTTFTGLGMYRALLDTGAQMSMIKRKVVDDNGLKLRGMKRIMGVTEVKLCNQYEVDIQMTKGISVQKVTGNESPKPEIIGKTFRGIKVTLMSDRFYGFDILLGMDILQQCYFAMHKNRFTICV